MSPELWMQIEQRVEEALDLEDPAREAFLNGLRTNEPEIVDEVISLVEAHRKVSQFLERPLINDWRPTDDEDLEAGQRVGPYRIAEVLGRGGMGTVYLAERDDNTFRKKVAFKVAHQHLRHPETLRRFAQERQILAGLEHPNIARLLDGGTSENGLPYLVMEHVDGTPIDAYCDREKASIKQRITLFLQVCEALQYAHGQLLVHRDVKPRNILVTRDGTPKLLDFGIAKILGPDPVSSPGETRTVLRPLTPAYASPEQLQGRAITTATDVYSLGILLYELLAGRLPFAASEEAPFAERQEPIPLSRALTRAFGADRETRLSADQIASRRGVTVKRLRSDLSGDLDNIVLKALQNDPTQRYLSVEQLAADLRRYLSGLPVRARAASWPYRTRKFIRRHRGAVATALLIALFGIGFVTQIVLQARVIRIENARSERERERAEQVSEFLSELFQASDPEVRQGDDTTLRDILERGTSSLAERLGDQPEARSALLHTLGDVYSSLGEFDKAEALLVESLSLRRRTSSGSNLPVAETLTTLGLNHSHAGRYAEARTCHREALGHRRNLLGESDPRVGESLYGLASAEYFSGRLDVAEGLLDDALTIYRADPDGNPVPLAETLTHLARVKLDRGVTQGVEPLLNEALAIRRRHDGPEHSRVAVILDTLAAFQREHGWFERAIPNYREALRIRETIYPPEHPEIITGQNNLGRTLTLSGETDEAIPMLRQAVESMSRLYGADHRYVMTGLHNLAQALSVHGEHREAEAMMRRAASLAPPNVPPQHPALLYANSGLGAVLFNSGQFQAAEPYLRRAVKARSRIVPPEHPRLAEEKVQLARCLSALGHHAEAFKILQQNLPILEARRPPQFPTTVQARELLRQAERALAPAPPTSR